MAAPWRVAVDIGGTFTDLAAWRQRQAEQLRAEAEALAADPDDRAEAKAVLADMESLRAW